MRRFAFVIMILGMFVLFWFMGSDGEEIESYEDLENLEINQKVFLEGRIISERIIYSGTKLIILDSGIELVCECVGNFIGEDVFVEGVVEEYKGKKQVGVLAITHVA